MGRQAIYTSKTTSSSYEEMSEVQQNPSAFLCIFFHYQPVFHQIYCNDSFSASRHSIDNYFINSTFLSFCTMSSTVCLLTIIEFFVMGILKQIRVLNFLDGMFFNFLSLEAFSKGLQILSSYSCFLIILLIRNTFIFISHFIKLIRSDILNQLRLIIKCNRLIKKL